MSAERFNQGPTTGDTAASQPEAPRPAFNAPLSPEVDIQHDAERKAKRNRRRRKKVLHNAVVQTVQTTPRPAKPAHESGTLAMDSGEHTLWQRPEDTPQTRAAASLGNKIVGLTEQAKPATLVPEKSDQQAPDRPEVDARFKDSDNVDKQTDHHHEPQSTVEHQGHEIPRIIPNEEDKNDSEHEPAAEVQPEAPISRPRPNPFEQSYEAPQAPPQPPDPMSYRRRFWNEQPAPIVAEHNSPHLPELHDYQHQAYEASQSEPTYSANRTQYAEAPAAVPLASNRYESPTPPGYQRTPADVNRAAWTGLFVGWWFGRRGKRKAIEQARKAGVKQGIASVKTAQSTPERRRTGETYVVPSSPRLEAEPIHPYRAPEGGRTVVQPLSVETRSATQRHAETAPVLDRLVSPIAAIAVFDRAINRSALERTELPRSIKIAAAKAAELLVDRSESQQPRAKLAGTERRLDNRELQRLSKDIKIEGVSLKEIYKAKRIDESGLRSIVNTYLAGGDVRQQLAHEVTGKEQTYELDPVLRHQQLDDVERQPEARGDRQSSSPPVSRSVESGAGFGSGAKTSGVGQTLGRALGTVAATTENTARSAGRVIASGAKTAQRDLIDNSNTTDWLSITAVVVLYSIILILLF